MSIRDIARKLCAIPARNLADEIAANAELQAQVDRLTAANMELARQLDAVSRERDEAREHLENMRLRLFHADSDCITWQNLVAHFRERFATIAAQETPGANATVKRMARMAREALE